MTTTEMVLAEVTYRLSAEPAPAVFIVSARRTVRRNPDGSSTRLVDLGYARSKGLGDDEAARRIVAVAESVDSGDVVLVSVKLDDMTTTVKGE